jgi:hypothetical protein
MFASIANDVGTTILDQLFDLVSEPKYLFAFVGVILTLMLRSAAGAVWRLVTTDKEMSEKAQHIMRMLEGDGIPSKWEWDSSRDGYLRCHPVQLDLDYRSPWIHVDGNDVDKFLTRRDKRAIRYAADKMIVRKLATARAAEDISIATALRNAEARCL